MAKSRPRIFVQIASYRDAECQWTVKDLFEKARHPDRIFVGICWQFVPDEDQDCFLMETRPQQVRISEFHVKDSKGVGWARNQVQKLWEGEEYTLQIDSHMRFVEGWDERMIDVLGNCDSSFPVISTYPPEYTPPNNLSEGSITYLISKEFREQGVPKQDSYLIPVEKAPSKPILGAFCSAGFLFAPSRVIEDVPYDPYLYFLGEETTLSVRLWTSGWDMFAPNEVLIYHYYGARAKRTKHWEDHKDWNELNKRSYRRIQHLLGAEISTDPEVIVELVKYGLGTKRSLSDYERFSGVDFKNQAVSDKTSKGEFVPLDKIPAAAEARHGKGKRATRKATPKAEETKDSMVGPSPGARRKIKLVANPAPVEELFVDGVAGVFNRSGVVKLNLFRVTGIEPGSKAELRQLCHRLVLPLTALPELLRLLQALTRTAPTESAQTSDKAGGGHEDPDSQDSDPAA